MFDVFTPKMNLLKHGDLVKEVINVSSCCQEQEGCVIYSEGNNCNLVHVCYRAHRPERQLTLTGNKY